MDVHIENYENTVIPSPPEDVCDKWQSTHIQQW